VARLILVRHGQTSANLDGLWHGSTDTPLTELGHQQAQWLGSHFHKVMKPDAIYASPLQRAHLTAQAIADNHHLTVNLDARLQEFCLGDWEGLKFSHISQTLDPDNRLASDPAFSPPGGESQNAVKRRMVEAIEEIVTRHEGENVVMVSHGVALAIALAHYLHQDTSRWMDYNHHNTAFSELSLKQKKLLFFNNTDHYME
jgi:broad specificity phosphatase PhoE